MTFSIATEESRLRDEICRVGRSLFDRRLTFGSSGNISARLADGTMLATPTNVALGELLPEAISHVGEDGRHLSGDWPTKEAFLHRCMYCARPTAGAVVHLHSTHSVAVSILAEVDPADVLPPLTAYYVMRVGRLPLAGYFPPGDAALAQEVERLAVDSHAVLLANHGPVVAGATLREAQFATEELEETARLFLMLRGERIRPLTAGQADALRRR
jgi:ribulose-5-phosphate 4-epimerase/fuculose-1-phosphate aldolase